MKKIGWLLILLILIYNNAKSQDFFISAGDHSTNQFYTLDWVLGEGVIGQYEDNEMMIYSGFMMPMEIDQEDIIQKDELLLFPNPLKEYVYIELSKFKDGEELQFNLIGLKGRLVKKGVIHNYTKVDLRSLDEGMYILNVFVNDNVYVEKLMKY